jgi:hypothetical protein
MGFGFTSVEREKLGFTDIYNGKEKAVGNGSPTPNPSDVRTPEELGRLSP